MKWNLRLAAANRGIWKASELQHLIAARLQVLEAARPLAEPTAALIC